MARSVGPAGFMEQEGCRHWAADLLNSVGPAPRQAPRHKRQAVSQRHTGRYTMGRCVRVGSQPCPQPGPSIAGVSCPPLADLEVALPAKSPPQLPPSLNHVVPTYDSLMRAAPQLPPPMVRPLQARAAPCASPRSGGEQRGGKEQGKGRERAGSRVPTKTTSAVQRGVSRSGGTNKQVAEGAVRSLLGKHSPTGQPQPDAEEPSAADTAGAAAETPPKAPSPPAKMSRRQSSAASAAEVPPKSPSPPARVNRRRSMGVGFAEGAQSGDPAAFCTSSSSSSASWARGEANSRRSNDSIGSNTGSGTDSRSNTDSPGFTGARHSTLSIDHPLVPKHDNLPSIWVPLGESGSLGLYAGPDVFSLGGSFTSDMAGQLGAAEGNERSGKKALGRFKTRLKDRLKHLEHRHAQRVEHTRTMREQDLKRRHFNALPQHEAEAMQHAFEHFDSDGSNSLNKAEVSEALRELGLRGTNTAEKREIMNICTSLATGTGDSGDRDSISIDFLTFALDIVPQVRERLAELQGNDLLRQFFQFDREGSGKLRIEQCVEITRNMGLDQRLMRSISEDTASADGCMEFDDFQKMVSQGREQLERVVRDRERHIKSTTGISDATFQQFRPDIVNLYDLFIRYDKDNSHLLEHAEIVQLFLEFGLLSKTGSSRKELDVIMKAADIDASAKFNFNEFLALTNQLRALRQARKRADQLQCFERYDKDKSGTLTIEEISCLLCDLGCVPRTRKEQEELAATIEVVDVDGNGFIDFEEFQILSQRIDERLKSMRFEEEVEYALSLGFSEMQLRDFRWVFNSLDADGSGYLDANEIRNCLTMMRKHVSHDAFEAAFTALDADNNGLLDFLEFIDFMKLLRDGEGLFSENAQNLPTRARFCEQRVLRRVLEYFGSTKAYISSLSLDELVELFCNAFKINTDDNIHEKLHINTVGELFDLTKRIVNGASPLLGRSVS